MAAEQVGRRVLDPTFRADLVGVEVKGRTRRMGGAKEAEGHQFVGVFGAEAGVGGITSAARGADHSLGKWARGASIVQRGAVSDAKTVLRWKLPEAHRACPDGRLLTGRLRRRAGRDLL